MISNSETRRWLRPCTWTYLLLLGLTLVTWGIGRIGAGGLQISLLVLAFALLKGQLIGDWYMGLKGVHGIWRWVVALWLIIPGSLIGIAFWIASGS